MSHFRKMEPFSEAALAADWKWGCGGRSPPPGARTKFGSCVCNPCAAKCKPPATECMPPNVRYQPVCHTLTDQTAPHATFSAICYI